MDVRDADGRLWTVTERVFPWRAWVLGRALRRGDELVPMPRKGYAEKPPTGERWMEAVLGFLLQPQLWILAILLSPFVLLEAVAQLVGAGFLSVARRLGMARRRVEVVAHTESLTHSKTVLLTRGDVAALIAEIGAERVDSRRTFHPSVLESDVEVTSHRSIWQSSGEWV